MRYVTAVLSYSHDKERRAAVRQVGTMGKGRLTSAMPSVEARALTDTKDVFT
jgi:hypothetical protein